MKIIFAGTPSFASVALEALLHSNHRVVAVLTQPDRQKGRGLKVASSPVKLLAQNYQIPIYQPTTLKEKTEEDLLTSFKADAMVVTAYGALLPANILNITRFGCLNIHPSLLPRWRGAAPIPRTIAAGDSISGVTIMQMDQGLDTGPILAQQTYVLDPNETTESLHDELAKLGASLLLEVLNQLEKGEIVSRPQDNALATYAHKISKEEALLDWSRDSVELEREIRAFNPWPVCYTSWQGKHLRIWQAKSIPGAQQVPPRTILKAGKDILEIATGNGALRLLQLQLPGGKTLSVNDFYNAKREALKVGELFH